MHYEPSKNIFTLQRLLNLQSFKTLGGPIPALMYIDKCTCTHIYPHMRVRIQMRIRVNTHVHTHARVPTHTHTHTRTHTHTHARTRTHTHTHARTHTHTHARTHTHTQRNYPPVILDHLVCWLLSCTILLACPAQVSMRLSSDKALASEVYYTFLLIGYPTWMSSHSHTDGLRYTLVVKLQW